MVIDEMGHEVTEERVQALLADFRFRSDNMAREVGLVVPALLNAFNASQRLTVRAYERRRETQNALAAARAEIAALRAEAQDWDSERMAYRRIARAYVALLECECTGRHGDENYHQAVALLAPEPQGSADSGEG